MKLAVMQPYLFPYIGYYQMVAEADVFICYDTADYIQRGWINRNRILISKNPTYFTVPVSKASLGTAINEITIVNFRKWRVKFLKTIEMNYKKAPHFKSTYKFLENFLSSKDYVFISNLAFDSINAVMEKLEMDINYKLASNIPINKTVNTKEEKLDFYMDYFKASEIILPPNSIDLYKEWEPVFGNKKFMKTPNIQYEQRGKVFYENLSIIDVLMFNSQETVVKYCNEISFV